MSEPQPPRDEPGADAHIKPGLAPSPLPREGESLGYQPVSGWAVAGFATSGLFAVMVLASTIVAIFQGAPIFFPVWLLSMAIVGIVLSFIGQNHVQNSEGTRTTRKPVNSFKGGFALIAKTAGAPVQTVFIETSSPFLSKGWSLFKKPDFPLVYRARLGRRFEVNGEVKAFVADLEDYYQESLHPGNTPRAAAISPQPRSRVA